MNNRLSVDTSYFQDICTFEDTVTQTPTPLMFEKIAMHIHLVIYKE